MADDNKKEIHITDHRKFNPDGTLREQTDAETDDRDDTSEPARSERSDSDNVVIFPGEGTRKKTTTAPIIQTPSGPDSEPQPKSGYSQKKPAFNPDEATFATLVNSLAVQAALHLGMIHSPSEPSLPVDLGAAKHLIDMIAVLQEKTHGNLTDEEADLIEAILADLRLYYVELARKQ